MEKEREEQVRIQAELQAQMKEEALKQARMQEQIEKEHALSTYMKTSDLDFEINPPVFKNDASSILSQDKSYSEEYSFINDIRTVYELQDEESKDPHPLQTL